MDWVPAHFPKDAHGLAYFDGTALYEHDDPLQGEHREWGTLIFNYGRNEVANFLISNALFWLDKYHIDGLRVDAVASMLYLDYSKKARRMDPQQVRRQREPGGGRLHQAVQRDRARPSSRRAHHCRGIDRLAGGLPPTYLGGLGFSMKWNMGWMNDILKYFADDPVFRKYHQNNLTFALLYAFTENFILVLSHDEVVYGKRSLLDKMPGDFWQKFANLRLLFSYMYAPARQEAPLHGRRDRAVVGVELDCQPRLASPPVRAPQEAPDLCQGPQQALSDRAVHA